MRLQCRGLFVCAEVATVILGLGRRARSFNWCISEAPAASRRSNGHNVEQNKELQTVFVSPAMNPYFGAGEKGVETL